MNIPDDLMDFHIARLRLKPGDTLIVRMKQIISMEVAQRVRDYVQPYVPEGVKVLVLDGEMEVSILEGEHDTGSDQRDV